MKLTETVRKESINVRNDLREKDEKLIKCSCGDYHKVGNLDVIQTRYHEHTGVKGLGVLSRDSNLIYICEKTGDINIFAFKGTPGGPLGTAEEGFKSMYKPVFRSVEDFYFIDSNESRKLLKELDEASCNYFVEQNLDDFDLK